MGKVRPSLKWALAMVGGLASLLIVRDAWAWGPGTHLYYGLGVIEELSSLGGAIRGILSSHVLPFLYGCVSADIVLAKKWGRASTHCHNWENGIRLIDEAKSDRTRAFSLGYVSHLAADTISHNCYVPAKSIESYNGGVLKHMYWELLFDQRVASPQTRVLFKEIASGDFSDCDAHFEGLVQTRLFDFSTNKRIFNQLLMLQSLNQWQGLWTRLSTGNGAFLRPSEVTNYSQRSIDAMMQFLKKGRDSTVVEADPIGEARLKAAHRLRRLYRQSLGRRRSRSAPAVVKRAAKRFASEPYSAIDTNEFNPA